jgi:hypothetical protein
MSLKKVRVTGNSKSENQALKVAMLSGKKGRGVVGFELAEGACVEFVPTEGGSLEIDTIGQWPEGLTVGQSGASALITNGGVTEEHKNKASKFDLNNVEGRNKESIDPVIIPR